MIGWRSLYPAVLLYFSYRRRRKYTFWRYSAWRRRSRSSRWVSFYTKVPICETPGTSWTSWSSSLGQYTQLALFWFRAFGVAPTPRGTGGGRREHVPPLLQMAGHGGHRQEKNSKRETDQTVLTITKALNTND